MLKNVLKSRVVVEIEFWDFQLFLIDNAGEELMKKARLFEKYRNRQFIL